MQKSVLTGEGGFSKVYRVTEEDGGRMVACKVIGRRDLAEREADFLIRAKHPLFPKYLGLRYLQTEYCLMMEYISGCSLKELVGRRGRLSVRQAAAIAYALAEGLLYLHELAEPVIFRDLKPENVMIEQNGRVRLVDLGCAVLLESPIQSLGGTKGYAAPEQLERNGHIGVESDVYALGKVLLFMLTGKEDGDWEQMERRGKRADKIPAELKRLVCNMTEQDQRRRIPDMRILMEGLRPYIRSIESREKRKGTAVRGSLKIRERKKGQWSAFYYERDVKRGF